MPLQKWENKVIASHVAEFESPPPPPPPPQIPSASHPSQQQQQLHFPPMHMMQNHLHYGATQNPYGATVKSEPVDSRYMLNPGMPYSLPPLPGPNINATRPYPPPPTQPQRIPQVDGPSDSSGGEEDSSPPPSGAFAPRTAHPSLPQPPAPTQQQPPTSTLDSEAINSDLDDSDTENEDDDEEGPSGDCDIVFCTYDKVTIFIYLLFHHPLIVSFSRLPE